MDNTANTAYKTELTAQRKIENTIKKTGDGIIQNTTEIRVYDDKTKISESRLPLLLIQKSQKQN